MTSQGGILYVVATPIGNKDDVTLRALNVFKKISVIFAEDTREIKKLLALHQIPMDDIQIYSYAKHNLKKATEKAMRILGEQKDIALVCDRGTPAISDPGRLMVRAAFDEGHAVRPVPGPSAVTTLFSVSGASESSFLFLGFLPLGTSERDALLDCVGQSGFSFCFFESPRRIRTTLDQLKKRFPSAEFYIGREMTKQFEEYIRVSSDFPSLDRFLEKGEYTVLCVPNQSSAPEDLDDFIALRLCSDREWSKRVAKKCGLSASAVYNSMQKLKTKN